jgi:hypothetical protein
MMMNLENSVEGELTEERGVLEENVPQCGFVHHKFLMN